MTQTTHARRSPIDAWIATHTTATIVHEGMLQADILAPTAATDQTVTLSEYSWRRRLGLKGPAAEQWLATEGYTVPALGNHWMVTSGVLVARLATSEFLVEALTLDAQARVLASAQALYGVTRLSGVYPVARHDLVLNVHGSALETLLRQVCSVDFAPLLASASDAQGPLSMTSMIGVGVVAIATRTTDLPVLTLWADPSFGHYFWTTLLQVATELGGGVRVHGPH